MDRIGPVFLCRHWLFLGEGAGIGRACYKLAPGRLPGGAGPVCVHVKPGDAVHQPGLRGGIRSPAQRPSHGGPLYLGGLLRG